MLAEVIKLFSENQRVFLEQAHESLKNNREIANGMIEVKESLESKMDALISGITILDQTLRGDSGYFKKIDQMNNDYQIVRGFVIVMGKLLSYTVAFSILGGIVWGLLRLWLFH